VSISNDILTEIWFAAALLVMVHYLRAAGRYRAGEAERPPGPFAMMSVGALIGLGLLTKSLATLLLPVAWFAAALGGRGPTGYEWPRLAREVLVSTGVALILGGWWLVRNQQLYGGLLAHQAFLSAFTDRPSPQYFMSTYHVGVGGYVVIVALWTLASVLGVFGPVTGNRFVFFPMWVYIIGGLAAVVGGVGFVRYLARAQLAPWQRQAWWLCGCLGVLLVASFVRFNLSFFQAQARYMFPGLLPAAALAFCLGLEEITPGGRRRWALLAAVAALALISFVGLPVWIMPEFQSP